MNELMMTGWLPEVGWMRGCRQACRSRVRSEIGRRDLAFAPKRPPPPQTASEAFAPLLCYLNTRKLSVYKHTLRVQR